MQKQEIDSRLFERTFCPQRSGLEGSIDYQNARYAKKQIDFDKQLWRYSTALIAFQGYHYRCKRCGIQSACDDNICEPERVDFE